VAAVAAVAEAGVALKKPIARLLSKSGLPALLDGGTALKNRLSRAYL
jgi:hypothetical protein